MRVTGKVRVTMNHCVEDILLGCGVEGVASTPAGDHFFDVEDLPLVSEDERKWFHSYVAKMLYVSERIKPEWLVATIFLASRVDKCNTICKEEATQVLMLHR